MTADLVAWLRAQLDADEQAARAASPGPWTVNDESYAETIYDANGQDVVSGGRWNGEASVFDSTEDAIHIARWNPARVLAEIDAKRRIIDRYLAGDTDMGSTHGPDWNEPESRQLGEDVLRLLALPYAGQPGYRDEWRPA